MTVEPDLALVAELSAVKSRIPSAPYMKGLARGRRGVRAPDVREGGFADVLEAEAPHREPLEPVAPRDHGVFDPEGHRDLGAEYARPTELQPLPVVPDLHLHGGLGVG